MSNTIPTQHPAVVLRSSYRQVRTLLALAALVIVGLTTAVAVLAISTAGSKTVVPPAHRAAAVLHANAAPAVTANPDQLGPQPPAPRASTPPSGAIDSYPGHF